MDNNGRALCFITPKTNLEKNPKMPVLSVSLEWEGKTIRIPLWYAMDRNTGEKKLTKDGNVYLTGKASLDDGKYKKPGVYEKKPDPQPPLFQSSNNELDSKLNKVLDDKLQGDDEIPF